MTRQPMAAHTRSALLASLAGGTAVFVVHAIFWHGYGWFRDEFYYLACAAHLDYGYVDHPALSIVPLWILRHTIGGSLFGMRLIVATTCGVVTFVVGLMAAGLGAATFGQVVAMTCVLVAPVYLALGSFYSMNVFDLLFWATAGWIAVELLKAPRTVMWIALGVVIGLGFENKISMLWLCGGLALGLVATPERRLLRTSGPWIAALLALALFTPYVLWQVRHGWPTAEFIHGAAADKMASHSPWSFLMSQVTDLHPFTVPVSLAGLFFYLWSPSGRRFRVLGVAFLAVLALLLLDSTSRSGYLAAGYTMLFAGGGVQVERMLSGRPAVRAALLVLLLAGGAITAPLGMPILPVDAYIRYAARLGQAPATEERKDVGALSQFYADRFGWDDMVRAVAAAYASLSPEDRRIAGIYAGNYGEAGAIDTLGPAYGLPRATSAHNNYWLWGPPSPATVMIVLTPTTKERLLTRFDEVSQAGSVECGLCMPYENHQPIFIVRGPKESWASRWPTLRHFD